jgi:DNA-directed RNA polymerase specialized sigma24 family protein
VPHPRAKFTSHITSHDHPDQKEENTLNNQSHPDHHHPDPNQEVHHTMNRAERRARRDRERFFTEFMSEVKNRMRTVGVRVGDREDCVSYICLWVAAREDRLIPNYTPRRLAAACTAQRAVDFIRQQARQLPFAGYDPVKRESVLKFVAFDALIDASDDNSLTVGDCISDGYRVDDEVADRQMYQARIREVTHDMTSTQKAVYIEVEINKMKVKAAAEKLGLKREYAQRRLGEARRIADLFRHH